LIEHNNIQKKQQYQYPEKQFRQDTKPWEEKTKDEKYHAAGQAAEKPVGEIQVFINGFEESFHAAYRGISIF
jgi:hypothetical protein